MRATSSRPRWLPGAVLALAAACGGGGGGDDGDGAGPDAAGCPTVTAAGACDATVTQVCPAPANHVPVGTTVEWTSNPPAIGPHYPMWARWNRTYADPPLERGYWLHNLEHGGVVLLYRCEDPCPDVVQGLEAVVDAIPDDPLCAPAVRVRAIVSADPLLPAHVQVAASAWGWTYTASCLDATSLAAFVADRYAKAPENTCAEGSFPAMP